MGESALLRQNVNCTEVVYYAAIYRTIISVCHSHSLARGNCAQNETAMAALQCLVVVYRYADIVRAYLFFLNAAKKTLSIVYELQLLPVLCPCTFSQRVFAEIHTFYSEFLVEPYVFLWMSLLREIFCTTFSKTSHAVDTTQARANCVQNENSETHALCASCVWIATSRCNPNNSKLREQYSPRSLFDVTF